MLAELSENFLVKLFEMRSSLKKVLVGHLETVCESDGSFMILIKVEK